MRFIEAALDDPEHIQAEGLAMSWLFRCAGIWQNFRKCWIPQIMAVWSREGIKTVILGKPNAGKSFIDECTSG